MAIKNFGSEDLAATTNTTLFQVGAGKEDTFNVNFCNRNGSAVTVRLAIAAAATPAASEWLEYDYPIEANSSFERTGLVAPDGKYIVVYSSSVSVSVNAYGFEEDA